MKGHNYGICKKCGKNHISPTLGQHYNGQGKHNSYNKLEYREKLRQLRVAKHLIGDRNYNWKGGEMDVNGYLWEYAPSHPFAINNHVAQHRYTMEQKMGRYLTPEEVVHHINEKRDDNRIENLQLCKNIGEHNSIHKKGKKK